MTNKEILEKAIQKAIDGGWYVRGGKVTEMYLVPNAGKGIWSQLYTWQKETDKQLGTGVHVVGGLYDFIFNHDFAKALWGEERGENVKVNKDGSISPIKASKPFGMYVIPAWQYHLQQMVIADDPIKYLGENI